MRRSGESKQAWKKRRREWEAAEQAKTSPGAGSVSATSPESDVAERIKRTREDARRIDKNAFPAEGAGRPHSPVEERIELLERKLAPGRPSGSVERRLAELEGGAPPPSTRSDTPAKSPGKDAPNASTKAKGKEPPKGEDAPNASTKAKKAPRERVAPEDAPTTILTHRGVFKSEAPPLQGEAAPAIGYGAPGVESVTAPPRLQGEAAPVIVPGEAGRVPASPPPVATVQHPPEVRAALADARAANPPTGSPAAPQPPPPPAETSPATTPAADPVSQAKTTREKIDEAIRDIRNEKTKQRLAALENAAGSKAPGGADDYSQYLPLAGAGAAGLGLGYLGSQMLGGEKQSSDGQVGEAAEALSRWEHLSPFDRRDLALWVRDNNLLGALAPKLASDVQAYSSPDMNPAIQSGLRTRARLVRATNAYCADAYEKLASDAVFHPAEEVLEAVTMLDRASGLEGEWGMCVPDPVRLVYGGEALVKKASREVVIEGVKLASVDSLNLFRTRPALTQWVRSCYGTKVASALAADPAGALSQMHPVDRKALVGRLRSEEAVRSGS